VQELATQAIAVRPAALRAWGSSSPWSSKKQAWTGRSTLQPAGRPALQFVYLPGPQMRGTGVTRPPACPIPNLFDLIRVTRLLDRLKLFWKGLETNDVRSRNKTNP